MAKVTSRAGEPDITDVMQEAILALRVKGSGLSKANMLSSFSSLEDAVDINNIPEESKLYLKSFNFQYLLNTKFLLPGTIVEIVGSPHVTKTTLVLRLIGDFMSQNSNIPALIVDTEGRNKFPTKDRILHTLSSDKVLSKSILKRISIIEGYPQQETLDAIKEFYKGLRDIMHKSHISDDVPIIVVVDTFSKMVPKSESGAIGYGDGKDKGIGNSSNLDFSKTAQEWMRKCPHDLEKYGVILVIVSHQNTKIDMGGRPSFISAEAMDAYNLTKIGGNALNQSSTIQLILTRKDSLRNPTTKEFIGYNVKINAMKNSRGQDRRSSIYTVNTAIPRDTESAYDLSLNLDSGLADIFANNKIKGVHVKNKRYFSSVLGISDMTAEEFGDYVSSNEKLKQELGSALHILGYPLGDTEDPIVIHESAEESDADNDIANTPIAEDTVTPPVENPAEDDTPSSLEDNSIVKRGRGRPKKA